MKAEPLNTELQYQLSFVLRELSDRLERLERDPGFVRQQLSILRGGARDVLSHVSQSSDETPSRWAVTLVERTAAREEAFFPMKERGQMLRTHFKETLALLDQGSISPQARGGIVRGLTEFGKKERRAGGEFLDAEIYQLLVREARSGDPDLSRQASRELVSLVEGLPAPALKKFDLVNDANALIDHQLVAADQNRYADPSMRELTKILLVVVEKESSPQSARALEILEERLRSVAITQELKIEMLSMIARVQKARPLLYARLFHADAKIADQSLELALQSARDEREVKDLLDRINTEMAQRSEEEQLTFTDRLVANLGSYSSSARVASVGILDALLRKDFSPGDIEAIQARLSCQEKVDNVSVVLGGAESVLGILTLMDGVSRSGGKVPIGATYNAARTKVEMIKTYKRQGPQEIARLQKEIRTLYLEKTSGRPLSVGAISSQCVEPKAQAESSSAPRTQALGTVDRKPAIVRGSLGR